MLEENTIPLHPDLELRRRGAVLRTEYFEHNISSPAQNPRLNRMYDYYKKLSETHRRNCDWEAYVSLFLPAEREYQLWEVQNEIEAKKFNQLVGWLWTHPEMICSGSCFVLSAAQNEPPYDKADLMTEEEHDEFKKLPDDLTIYRAHEPWNQMGPCWTLSEKVAWNYAHFPKWIHVSRAVIAKHDVFAYFQRRGESEIIVKYPSKITIEEMVTLE
jgi:hypothetical protein